MKKKKTKKTLGNFYSPYLKDGEDMNVWFEAYKNDAEKLIEIDGKVYTKIIHRCEFYIYEDFTLLIAFEPQENLCVGDVLVDELGHEFKIKAFEMFRFAGKIPDWAFKIFSMSITGQDYTIGNYIAKK